MSILRLCQVSQHSIVQDSGNVWYSMQAGKPVDDVCYDCGRTAKSVFYHSGLAHTGQAFSHSQCYIPSNIQSSEERTSRFADHPACRSAVYKHVREQAQHLEMFRGRGAAASPHGHDHASHHPVCQHARHGACSSYRTTAAVTIVTGRHCEICFLAGRPI